MNKKPTILLAGGGTAGHINPLLATADALQAQGYGILIIGTEQGKETELVPAAGYQLHTIERAPFPRRPGREVFTFPGKYRRAKQQVRKLMLSRHVACVVGFGGYVCPPAYAIAKKLGIPVVIHEQNARPGLANKMGARRARVLGLTFPGTPLKASQGKTVLTGLPLRGQIQSLVEARRTPQGARAAREKAAQLFGFNPDLPTLVVSGGSLGAQKINESLSESLPHLPQGVQILHLTGKGKAAAATAQVEKLGLQERVKVLEYAYDMASALAVADLAVGRSGAGTVAEQTALHLPSIYVPFPIGNGEQKLNAQGSVQAGASLLCLNEDFTPEYVQQTVFKLLLDSEQLEQMAEAALNLKADNGTQNLVRLIVEEVK